LDRKLLLFELNEVPYRILDKYCADRPSSTLSALLLRSVQYRTHTPDRLALDPWISWPTLHRGVPDETHGILHLGQKLQDVDAQYPPVWRVLRQCGISVGVFGSLHSSSVPDDVADYDFYVPDYFDASAFAHPPELLPFQELNLAMTRQSARNVTRRIPVKSMVRFAATAPGLGLKMSTVADASGHLFKELFDGSLRVRRRAYQPLVMADLFLHQMERSQPQFATFYTNHVAAAMHRYWGAAFPEDYEQPLDREWIDQYSSEITFAMDKQDAILRKLVAFVHRHPEYVLLIATSMGQAAIPAQRTLEFLTITDLDQFMTALGVPAGGWTAQPAMVPCRSVMVHPQYRASVAAALATLEISGARSKLDRRPIAPISYDEQADGGFQLFVQFDSYGGAHQATIGGRSVPFEAAGLGMVPHEDGVNCTAQHVSEGSLFVYNTGAPATDSREDIATSDVAPSILKFFGRSAPGYMHGRACVQLKA
jgi:hypothetical protein